MIYTGLDAMYQYRAIQFLTMIQTRPDKEDNDKEDNNKEDDEKEVNNNEDKNNKDNKDKDK